MKKILALLTCASLALSFCFCLAGCKKTNKKSSNSTQNIEANGGMVVKNGSTLYFLDTTTESATIYKATLNENQEFESAPKAFVKNVVGTKNGSLYIFGDYLYFVATSTDRDAAGEIQSGILKFCRIPLKGGKIKTLYQTQSSDESNLQYAYYKRGTEDLYLVVYEGSQKTITSIEIGTNPKKNIIAKEVSSVLLAENGNSDGANEYVYYTKAKDKKLANQTGNIVERVLPDGSSKETISTKDVTYSLTTIAGGKLIYSDGNYIRINDGGKLLSTDKVLSYLSASTYSQIIYDSDSIYVLATNEIDSETTYELWQIAYTENGEMQKTVIKDGFKSEIEFLLKNEDVLYYVNSDKVYAINLSGEYDIKEITETSVNAAEGYIAPEIIDDYLYFMSTEDGTKIYRANINVDEAEDAEELI